MFKVHHILNQYKQWGLRTTAPPSDGVAFYQNITKISNSHFNNNDWQKIATWNECVKKGHIGPFLPNTKDDKEDENERNNNEKNKTQKKPQNKGKPEETHKIYAGHV